MNQINFNNLNHNTLEILNSMKLLNKILIKENSSLLDAILKPNNTGTRCLFQVGKGNFKGTLTDGDIRRSIIKQKFCFEY